MRWIFLAPFVVLSSFFLSTKTGQAQLGITYGDAVNLGGGCYQLTDSSIAQRGAVWYFGTVDVSQSWEMTANIFMGSSDSGADGLVFVLRDPNSSSLGSSGSKLGYGGSINYEAIQPSLGVEIDTYGASSYGDPWFDHIAILSNGVVDHNAPESLTMPVSVIADSSNIEIGEEFELRVTYCASSQIMTIFWDEQARLSEVVDLGFIGTNLVRWGFTASTGYFSNQHRVCGAHFVELDEGGVCECLDSNMNVICDDLEGCVDVTACNFDPAAEADNGTCDYTCCPGPGCCSDGMYWDYNLQVCQVIETCEDDLDGDGVVGVNDLMQLLSSFGTDCPLVEPDEWTCGDPVSYHGYDYETVLIGEQCWFAENLRTELYQNGDLIPDELNEEEWVSTSAGATGVYNQQESSLMTYGRVYNGYAVEDYRGLCPSDWSVPSDLDWQTLEQFLGMDETESQNLYWRGSNEGQALKAQVWGNGLDSFAFQATPGGGRNHASGDYVDQEEIGYWWSRSFHIDGLYYRRLDSNEDRVFRTYPSRNYGFSIRCIQD